ncbi:MAG: hypothetical protein K9K64_04080 [Desulfohalobiaceae bacterium]|nr:hypothetical protein [Desulfohalobiaceae bacterium]
MSKDFKISGRDNLFSQLEGLYARIQEQYDLTAGSIGLDCRACPDNCCLSYFQHHTYIEWAYLWHGLMKLPKETRESYLQKARDYLVQQDRCLREGRTPEIMCPLNVRGLCSMYGYRLMICRLHGVPNQVKMPDGSLRKFPGCIVCQRKSREVSRIPVLDRTPYYIRLVELERKLRKGSARTLPKVDLTLAEMLVKGPPEFSIDQ